MKLNRLYEDAGHKGYPNTTEPVVDGNKFPFAKLKLDMEEDEDVDEDIERTAPSPGSIRTKIPSLPKKMRRSDNIEDIYQDEIDETIYTHRGAWK